MQYAYEKQSKELPQAAPSVRQASQTCVARSNATMPLGGGSVPESVKQVIIALDSAAQVVSELQGSAMTHW